MKKQKRNQSCPFTLSKIGTACFKWARRTRRKTRAEHQAHKNYHLFRANCRQLPTVVSCPPTVGVWCSTAGTSSLQFFLILMCPCWPPSCTTEYICSGTRCPRQISVFRFSARTLPEYSISRCPSKYSHSQPHAPSKQQDCKQSETHQQRCMPSRQPPHHVPPQPRMTTTRTTTGRTHNPRPIPEPPNPRPPPAQRTPTATQSTARTNPQHPRTSSVPPQAHSHV